MKQNYRIWILISLGSLSGSILQAKAETPIVPEMPIFEIETIEIPTESVTFKEVIVPMVDLEEMPVPQARSNGHTPTFLNEKKQDAYQFEKPQHSKVSGQRPQALSLVFTEQQRSLSDQMSQKLQPYAVYLTGASKQRLKITSLAFDVDKELEEAEYRAAFNRGQEVRNFFVDQGVERYRLLLSTQILPHKQNNLSHRVDLELLP